MQSGRNTLWEKCVLFRADYRSDVLTGNVHASSALFERRLSRGKYTMLGSPRWTRCTWVRVFYFFSFPTDITSAGFYIHSCPKMKYKGEYTPSFLADPVSVL